jgi:hypothetical protein
VKGRISDQYVGEVELSRTICRKKRTLAHLLDGRSCSHTRDQFLVTYSLFGAKKGYDFKTESKRIADETKKLIGARFPEE